MKVLMVAGAHLQFIKAAVVSRALDAVHKTSGKQESLRESLCIPGDTATSTCLRCFIAS